MKPVWIFFLIISFVFIIQAFNVTERAPDNRNHYSRSITSLQDLLVFNGYLVDNLEIFIQHLKKKLEVIIVGIEEMKDRHQKAEENIDRFVENSLNSFSLLRHMGSDWLYWQLYMEEIDLESINHMEEKKHLLAIKTDLIDAAESMRRIQKVYQLSPLDMAKGLLDGVQYNITLSPLDCYELAKYNYEVSFWQAAEEWLLATIWSFGQPDQRPEIHKLHGLRLATVYDDLACVRVKQNNFADALDAQRFAFELSPRNATLLQKLNKMEKEFLTYHPIEKVNASNLEYEDEVDLKSNLPFCCSGKCEKSKSLELYCLYKRNGSHFLTLAPVKMEVLSLNPFVVIYHDVISEREQHILKTMNSKNLTVTETITLDLGIILSSARTAKGVWYSDNSFNITQRLNQLIEDITNLNPLIGDAFQIINYGVGGLFENHYDTLITDEDRHKNVTERLATMIFYLSDVPQGGATLMTNLNLTIFPKAGSALYFYNLNNAGDEIFDVLHTGCPVIVGSKWIMTKWIFDIGQEFRNPCYKTNK